MDKIRILIVDDETDAGEILSLRLARRGFEPAYASSGEAALAHLAAHPVDVVLLDIKMPGMDGLEVLAHICERHPAVSTLIISGHADMDAATKGLELGAFHYQLKPIELETLCHKIEDAVRQKELEGARPGAAG